MDADAVACMDLAADDFPFPACSDLVSCVPALSAVAAVLGTAVATEAMLGYSHPSSSAGSGLASAHSSAMHSEITASMLSDRCSFLSPCELPAGLERSAVSERQLVAVADVSRHQTLISSRKALDSLRTSFAR